MSRIKKKNGVGEVDGEFEVQDEVFEDCEEGRV